MQDSAPNNYLVTKKPDISLVIEKYESTDSNMSHQISPFLEP